ncbi:MAG: class I SAM-dependent methyltransferase [Candidatus Bathyarchaeota archaeon]|nr:class I SAM-dependent methyltransferase [Candidatus Bathyarchaeota archaeon]
MNSKVIEAHEYSASQYDKICFQIESHTHEVLFGLVFEYINPNEELLDIGIGTGLSSTLFHKAGLQIYGLDKSEKMLAVCKEKGFAKELKTYDLSRGGWPFEAHKFHHAIACGVFHFFRSLEVFFQEAHRLLKDQGTFSFTLIDGQGRSSYVDSGIRICCHDENKMLQLAQDTGFVLLKKLPFSSFGHPEQKELIPYKAYTFRKK